MATYPIVQAENLHKHVRSGDSQLQILSDINLIIYPGETLAITGASGSGKSTLLSLLAGLDTPSSGRVLLNGHDLTTLNEDGRAALRANYVGFIFQSFHLLPSLTALENILLPLELKNSRDAQRQAIDLLEKIGLSKRAHHYPRQLSGGEQQRIAIARAFAAQPILLFADEITGNLDNKTGAHITELLFEFNTQKQTTLVLVTHEERLAQRCQRRIELDSGKIIVP